MFEKHKEKVAQEHLHEALAEWEAHRDATAQLLSLVRTFNGDSTSAIILKAGEGVFATVTGASLVEERRGAGHWSGASHGVSVPIGSIGGHAIRYHVGATRGHYVQAPPVPTAIDVGTVFVTNQRVIFQGARQTRECLFAKLIGFQHEADGTTAFSVSNRQKPTVIHYGTNISSWFDFRLDLALAHYRGTVPELVATLEQQEKAIEAARPAAPAPNGGAA